MSIKWEDFIDNLKDEAGKLAKDELKNIVSTSKNDANDFVKKQGEKLESYLSQLANNQITKEQFEGYVRDLKNLTELQSLKMSVAAKASAQRLANGIEKLVLNGLLKLLVG